MEFYDKRQENISYVLWIQSFIRASVKKNLDGKHG